MTKSTTTTTCPRCGREGETPALSRKDNVTHVCSSCGTDEGMAQFKGGRDAEVWPGYPGIAEQYRR